jgi:hypothetical protein
LVLVLTFLRVVRSKCWPALERWTASSPISIWSWHVLGWAWGVRLWRWHDLTIPWLSPSLWVNTLLSSIFRYWPFGQTKVRHSLPNRSCYICVGVRLQLWFTVVGHILRKWEILRRELHGLLILMGFGLIWMDCTLFTLLHIRFAKTTDLHRFC